MQNLCVRQQLADRHSRIAIVVILTLLIAVAGYGQVTFIDDSNKLGLNNIGTKTAWGDFNNDGYVDLCDGNTLWINNEANGFTKREKVGPSVLADFDNDGLIDLFSCSVYGLFRNLSGNKLDKINLPPLQQGFTPKVACWGDFNKDGYVDIYVGDYKRWEPYYPGIVLTNLKGQSFKYNYPDPCICCPVKGVTACDFDEDGDLDIYVSNYSIFSPNVLWINDGTGSFKDVATYYNVVIKGSHSMGAVWGDFDNDGLFDLFVSNLAHDKDGISPGNPSVRQPESLFLRNLGPEKKYIFEDRGQCDVNYQEYYSSPAAGDYDNDGDLDLFITTESDGNNNRLYRNDGNWNFNDVTEQAGLSKLKNTHQAAWADFDNDGDLDLVTARKLFVNQIVEQGSTNNWLKVRLYGDGKQINSSAIGAQVRIKLKDRVLTRQVEAGTGAGNQNDLTLHFGLGTHNEAVKLEIFWPNGSIQTVEGKLNHLNKVYFKAE